MDPVEEEHQARRVEEREYSEISNLLLLS